MEDNNLDPTGYFAHSAWSNSKLSAFIRTRQGGFVPPISEKASTMGRLLHTLTFEPLLAGQQILEAGRILVKKEINLVLAMADAIRGHRTLTEFLNCGHTFFEKEYFFELHGLPFKAKMDAVCLPFIGDAKSTSCRTYDEFLDSCVKYGYFRQAVIYMHATGAEHFYLWGVTKHYPHNVFFVSVGNEPHLLAEAAREVEHWCGVIRDGSVEETELVSLKDFNI